MDLRQLWFMVNDSRFMVQGEWFLRPFFNEQSSSEGLMKADQICYWSTSLLALGVGDLRAFILFLPICLVVKIFFAIFANGKGYRYLL